MLRQKKIENQRLGGGEVKSALPIIGLSLILGLGFIEGVALADAQALKPIRTLKARIDFPIRIEPPEERRTFEGFLTLNEIPRQGWARWFLSPKHRVTFRADTPDHESTALTEALESLQATLLEYFDSVAFFNLSAMDLKISGSVGIESQGEGGVRTKRVYEISDAVGHTRTESKPLKEWMDAHGQFTSFCVYEMLAQLK